MPAESILVTVGVVAVMLVFAVTLFWGDMQTRTPKR